MTITPLQTQPLCEVCGEHQATAFSHFLNQEQDLHGWKFCCACTSGRENYYIEFDRFFASPFETMDWLAHMHKKTWMDWNDFMDMAQRYRSKSRA